MNKAELIAAIVSIIPAALSVNESATNAELEAALSVLEASDKLDAANETNAALNKELEEAKADITSKENSLLNLNEALSTAQTSANAQGGQKPTVKVGDDLYIVKSGAKIRYEDVPYEFSVEQIVANAEIESLKKGPADILVEIGFKLLKKI